jgi:Mg2+ and Co2+ transporter CorA
MPTVCDMLQALHTDNLTLFAEQQKNFNQDLFLKEEFFKGCSAFLVAIRELLRNISTIIYQSDSNNTNPEQITSLHSLLTNIQKSIPESTGQLKKLISDNGFQLDEITNALDDSSDSLNAYLSDLKTYLAKYSDLSQQDAALLKNLLEEPYD